MMRMWKLEPHNYQEVKGTCKKKCTQGRVNTGMWGKRVGLYYFFYYFLFNFYLFYYFLLPAKSPQHKRKCIFLTNHSKLEDEWE